MTVQLACLAQDVPVEGTYRVELEDDAGKIVEVAVVRDSDGECWLHGSRFDLRTGQPDAPPAVRPIPVYPLTVDGENVLVDVDAPL